MWIETRYYDDGRVLAKLHTGQKVTIRDDADYDSYITTLTEEYSLEDVVSELDVYDEELASYILRELRSGKWLNITEWV